MVVLLCGFATVALNARALGPASFGMFLLIQSVCQTIGRVVTFETWQPVLRFGAIAKENGDATRFLEIAKTGLLFDMAAALLGGVAAQALIWLAGRWIGIGNDELMWCSIYAMSLFFIMTGTPTGLLRLANRFSVLTGMSVGAAVVRTLLSLVLFGTQAGFLLYIVGFALVDVLFSIGLLVSAWIAIRQRKLPCPDRIGLSAPDRAVVREFLSFAWTSSAVGAINALRMQADLWIASALLGPSAAAAYGIGQKLSAPILMLADPVRHAIHPEIAVFAARGRFEDLASVARRVSLLALLVAAPLMLVYVAFGGVALHLLAGPAFADGYWPLVALSLSGCIYLVFSSLPPVVLTLCSPLLFLGSYVLSAGVAVPVAYLAIRHGGVHAAGIGQLVFIGIWVLTNILNLRYRRLKSERTPPETLEAVPLA